ncbi:response regulator [Oryzomonas sagensis]|uniref:Response regulator n=1 Tax=Oryzomonas sagensis TaxID=2603857 RepID=A0ABQ6TSA2_9BACT|nr:response regulator [Oryzomonas sagensis]KAB0671916.1 response regulator [Oryzomonas sagensis]
MSNAKVMIVDDALFMRKNLGTILRDKGYTVVAEAASGIETMKKLHDCDPDIVFLDIILPDANGMQLLDFIRNIKPQVKVILCSAIGQEAIVKKGLESGASFFVQKPFNPEKIAEALENLGE